MDKNTKKLIAFAGVSATAIALGTYTQMVDWNPVLRTGAHFMGAMVVPSAASFITSSMIYSYEEHKNKKMQKDKDKTNNNKEKDIDLKDLEEQKYKVSPKTKDFLMKTGMVVGTLGYMLFSAGWESWQFSNTNIFQASQYIADFGGPLVGMLNIGVVDSAPYHNLLNGIENKVKNFFKKDKEPIVEQIKSDNLQAMEQDENIKNVLKKEVPVWDLSLYEPVNETKAVVQNVKELDIKENSKPKEKQDDGFYR